MKLTTPKTGLIVMNGGRARIFTMRKAPRSFERLHEMESEQRHASSHELSDHSLSRERNAAGPASHVKEPRLDPREQEEQRFTDEVIAVAQKLQQRDSLDEWVIVADPKTLGRLRKQLPKAMMDRVQQGFDRDLTGQGDDEVRSRVMNALEWPAVD